LDQLAEFQTARVDKRQQHDEKDGDELLRRKTDGVVSRNVDRRDDPGGRRDRRHEHAEETREADGDRRNRPRLDNEKERPTVEKAPERRVGFAQVHVLPARLRHHGGEFAVRERGGDGQKSCNDPDGEQPTGGADLSRDVCRDNKNAGANH
jgi:hypothetical protein